MKIIVAPDKFKGSLTTFEVCEAIAAGIREVDETAEIVSFPMADGGDGFSQVMKYYLQTETIHCVTVDPLGRKMDASYQWSSITKTAIVEMAVASGLVLLTDEERNPMKTSTYGTGLLIKNAIDKGAEKIILGLGGSATNDAGIGILAALGFQFLNAEGNMLEPSGGNLSAIERIVYPGSTAAVKFIIACDVQNVLYGPHGAAYVYSPQKGADAETVQFLDQGLRHFSRLLEKNSGKDVSKIPGTGAAGGIAAGLMSFFEVELRRGIELIIDASGIKSGLPTADLVITGEGKIDKQTLDGKVVSEIASLAFANKISIVAFCGILEASKSAIQQLHLEFADSLVDKLTSEEAAMNGAKEILIKKVALFFKRFRS